MSAGELTEAEWDAKYTVLDSPEGSSIWEWTDLVQALPDPPAYSSQVWTVVDGDDGVMYVCAGVHTVNRVGYVVTEEEWEDSDEVAVWYDPNEWERDAIPAQNKEEWA